MSATDGASIQQTFPLLPDIPFDRRRDIGYSPWPTRNQRRAQKGLRLCVKAHVNDGLEPRSQKTLC
jgi:hypothetical protein